MTTETSARDLTSEQVQAALSTQSIYLIDVREVAEFTQYRIAGSLNFPLSSFDPTALPQDDREIILTCARGMRSLRAMDLCQAAGLKVTSHLAVGVMGWAEEGYPLEG